MLLKRGLASLAIGVNLKIMAKVAVVENRFCRLLDGNLMRAFLKLPV